MFSEAASDLRTALKQAQDLAVKVPDDPAHQINLCLIETDLARVHRSLGELAEARDLLERSKKRLGTMRNDRRDRVEKLKERVDDALLRLAEQP